MQELSLNITVCLKIFSLVFFIQFCKKGANPTANFKA